MLHSYSSAADNFAADSSVADSFAAGYSAVDNFAAVGSFGSAVQILVLLLGEGRFCERCPVRFCRMA